VITIVHCKEFLEKWREDPNFCNRNKSAVNDINNHIKILDELESDYGVPISTSTMADKFTERASRVLRREKNRDVKLKATKIIAEKLKSGEKVTTKTTQQILSGARLEVINNGSDSNFTT